MEKRGRPAKQATLCVIVVGDKMLLGMKKRGFGVGKYNGMGGKVNPGETVEQAALRELQEESSLSSDSLKKVGEFDFYFPHRPEFDQTVHTFLINSFTGEPKESEEMAFEWFELGKIPYDKMWDDDKYWLPKVLEGKKLVADFVFRDENGQSIVDQQEIREVQDF